MTKEYPEIMVSIQKAADYTGLSYYCIRKLCRNHQITYILSGRKHCVEEIGSKETRFHDLRHSCAIMELQAGCSVKSIQSQLGHFSSSFTMDAYAAVSNTMKKDTQDRMEQLFQRSYSSSNHSDLGSDSRLGSKLGSEEKAETLAGT